MFRSSRSVPQVRRWATAIVVALISLVLTTMPLATPPAHADIFDATVPLDPNGARFPTIPLSGPTVPLLVVTQDLGNLAQVKAGSSQYQARLNASVAFAKDSAVLLPAAMTRLEAIAAELAKRPKGTVAITGYTDDLGSAEHGLVLSKQRADAVRSVLAIKLTGFSFAVAGKGEADPIAPNNSEKNRAKNRRVEISWKPAS